MTIKVQTTTTHQRTSKVSLDEKQIVAALAAAVAKAAGVDLASDGVKVKVIFNSRERTGIAGVEAYAEVTITEDFTKMPAIAERLE